MRRETFQTPGEVTLDLSLPEGRIEILSTEGTTTEIELDALGNGDDAQRVVDGARIELRGDHVVVSVPKRGFLNFLRDLDLQLQIRAPHGAHIRSETASAQLRGRGRFGSLEAKSASGDVDLDELTGDAIAKTASADIGLVAVGGDAVVNTASGDVELGRVGGETVVKTASGDVTIREGGRSIDVSTASGDLRVEAVAEGTVKLQSASGDIGVGIRQGSNVWVDARAMSGETRSELELDDAPPSDDAPLVELRATSMSGDVTVRRAPGK
jgi:hypothetical protein